MWSILSPEINGLEPLGGVVLPPYGNFVKLPANGESGGKILPAVFLTFQWLLNSEKTRFVAKAVLEI